MRELGKRGLEREREREIERERKSESGECVMKVQVMVVAVGIVKTRIDFYERHKSIQLLKFGLEFIKWIQIFYDKISFRILPA